MLTLAFMRHASTTPIQGGLSDFERRLLPNAQQEVPSTVQQLMQLGISFEHILCSSAKRAQQTLSLVLEECPKKPSTETLGEFYDADPERIFSSLMVNLQGNHSKVLCIGHNPTWPWMIERLSHEPVGMIPASCAVLQTLGPNWQNSLSNTWTLQHFIQPL